jgi:hypothetical protein
MRAWQLIRALVEISLRSSVESGLACTCGEAGGLESLRKNWKASSTLTDRDHQFLQPNHLLSLHKSATDMSDFVFDGEAPMEYRIPSPNATVPLIEIDNRCHS